MSEWRSVVLGDIGFFSNGINKGNESFGYGVPFVNLLDIFDKSSINSFPKDLVNASESEISRYSLRKGDILFVRSSVKPEGVGKTCIVLRDLPGTVYSGFIIRFRQGESIIDADFSKYCFDNSVFRRQILSYSSVSANTNVNQVSLKKLKIDIPTFLPEQRKIARILSTVDAVIEKTEAAIVKYKAIKAGMMRDLFTRGIDLATGKLRPSYEDAPELYKESELGWVPKEWEAVRIDEIAFMKSGEGITSKSIFDFARYPVYGGNGLRGFTTTYTHDGDFVLIGRQGALCGNVNRVAGKFYASEHAVVVSVFNQIAVDWLSQLLSGMNLNQYSEASAQPGLAVSKILSLVVKRPQFNEQKEIAKHLLSVDLKADIESKILRKHQHIKQALMSDLLTGKVRVKYEEEKTEAM